MIIIYDEKVAEIEMFDLVSNMFGDVWDMIWHHHWCLGNYLEPY